MHASRLAGGNHHAATPIDHLADDADDRNPAGLHFASPAARAAQSAASPGDHIDYQACGFVIAQVRTVDEIKSRRKKIRAHDKSLRLVEVKLVGEAPRSGVLVTHPQSFSVICDDEGAPYSALSRAIGQKIERACGEREEFWSIPVKNATVSALHELEAGSGIEFYVIFDVPKTARALRVQVPSILPGAGTIEEPGD